MIQFNISAPGTIVLSGDHAVMYDEKNVVIASLDLRTTLKFCELPDEQQIIKIEFSTIDLSLEVPLQKARQSFLRNDKQIFIKTVYQLLRYVKKFVDVNGMWRTREQRLSLQTFFFLLSYTAYTKKLKMRPFHVNVTTELPINGGLGSSTSFAVCLAACFIHWARLQKGAHDEFDNDDLARIYGYTLLSEYSIRDYALEFGNKVCTYGKIHILKYINFEDHTDQISQNMQEIKILLIDAKVCRNNRERLQQMAELSHICPKLANYILDKVNAISQKIFDTLIDMTCSTRSSSSHQMDTYAKLQEHIHKNQQILCDNGLSHPRLDDICSIAESYGFAGKLTGFGGGFVYIPLPPIIPEEQIAKLLKKLSEENCNVTVTNVGCSGVRIDDGLD